MARLTVLDTAGANALVVGMPAAATQVRADMGRGTRAALTAQEVQIAAAHSMVTSLSTIPPRRHRSRAKWILGPPTLLLDTNRTVI